MADKSIKLILETFKKGTGVEETAKAIRELERQAADLKKVMEQGGLTHAQYSNAVKELGLKVKDTNPMLGQMKNAFAAILPAMSVAAVVAGMKSMSDSARAYGESVDKVTDITGVSAEQASKWVVQAQHVGVGAETIANGMKLLSRNLIENKDFFNEWGVAIEDTKTKTLLPLDQIIDNVRKREKELGDGANATAMEMKLFGRSGAELHDFLSASNDEMERTVQTARNLGLILDDLSKDKMEQTNRKLNDMKMVSEALGNKINELVLPAIIEFEAMLIKVLETGSKGGLLAKFFDGFVDHAGKAAVSVGRSWADTSKKIVLLSKEEKDKLSEDTKNFYEYKTKLLDGDLAAQSRNFKQALANHKLNTKDRKKIDEEYHLWKKSQDDLAVKKYIDDSKLKSGQDLLYYSELLLQEQASTTAKSAEWYKYQAEIEKTQLAIETKNRETTIKMIEDYSKNFFDGILTGSWSIESAFDRMKNNVLKTWEDMIADMVAKWIASEILHLPVGTQSVGGGGGGGSQTGTSDIGKAAAEVIGGKSSVAGEIGDAAQQLAKGDIGGAVVSVGQGIADFFLGKWFADGGIVNKPTFGMVGEGGEPEAIIPLSKAKDFGFGGEGGGDINITINTMAYSGDDKSIRALAREIDKALYKEKRIGRTVSV